MQSLCGTDIGLQIVTHTLCVAILFLCCCFLPRDSPRHLASVFVLKMRFSQNERVACPEAWQQNNSNSCAVTLCARHPQNTLNRMRLCAFGVLHIW